MTRKIYLMLLSVFLSVTYLSAQVVQTVNVSTAGGLATAIGSNLKTVTDLTLTGTINATDFNTIKQMTALKNLDMSQVAVVDNRIPAQAFQGRVLNSLQLPNTIKSIGNFSFMLMKASDFNISQLTNLETIGSQAFREIEVPSLDFSKCTKLKSIDYYAFGGAKLKNMVLDFSNSANLSVGVTGNFGTAEIWGSFSDFSGHVILPKAMTHLFNNAFSAFRGSVEFPPNLESIGENAFRNSTPSQSLQLPNTIKNIGNYSFMLMKISGLNISELTNLETIGIQAFREIEVPSLDFSKCTKLKSIDFYAFGVAKLDQMVLDFSNSANLSVGVTGNFGTAEIWGSFSDFGGHVILPKAMTHLFNNAFSAFRGSVEFPPNLESIGENAFRNSTPSQSLQLPNTITSIGGRAFFEMSIPSLDLTQIPRLENIGHEAFNGITVSELDFSKSTNLKSIGYNAFANVKIEKMELDFSNSSNLSEGEIYANYGSFSFFKGHVILPRAMTHLFNNAFYQFRGTVILPQGLKTIGNNAFQSSTIKKIDLPASVTSIGANAFNGASQLSKIISNNPTPPTLGANVFNGVNKETAVLKVPDSSINLYGTAPQWKDFLNIKVGVPSKLDLTYKINGANWGKLGDPRDVDLEYPYQGIRIGEYYWMNTNFNHIEKARIFSGNGLYLSGEEEAKNPMTQKVIDKYLSEMDVPDQTQFKVDIAQYRKDFGTYYNYFTIDYMNYYGTIFENDRVQSDSTWRMPYMRDYRQLIAMSPFVNNNAKELSAHEAMYALAAGSTRNEMASHSIIGSCGGNWGYWAHQFGDVGGDKYGFSLMPSGMRLGGSDSWGTEICGEAKNRDGEKGDLLQTYHRAVMPAKDGHVSFHETISTLQQNHHDGFYCENGEGVPHFGIAFQWMAMRWCRILTDEELGYKLYIKIDNISTSNEEWKLFAEKAYEIDLLNKMRNENIPTDQTSIIKLGLHDAVPTGYIELPHGYIRGFYVQHILDNPNTTVTVADVIKYAYGVQDFVLDYKQEYGRLPGWSIPSPTKALACQPKTRTVESDDVVVPFKTDASVTLYPNPVQDVLNISGDGVEKVTIYNMSGRQVFTAKNINTISVSDLSKGTYLVRVLTANGESTHKVIKK